MDKSRKIFPYFLSDQIDLPEILFERQPSTEYLEEWTDVLKKKITIESELGILSVIVFRLGNEWLALKTTVFKEVVHRRPVHQIPHRTEKILKGVVNLDGQLQLCIALNELLMIKTDEKPSTKDFSYQHNRMIAIEKEKDLWVFPVEEIDGMHAWDKNKLENVPITIIKSSASYLSRIMNNEHRSIGLIDEDLLFYSLRRSLL